MVSLYTLLPLAAFVAGAWVDAQTPSPIADARSGSVAAPAPQPDKPLTPEHRGDVMMARKMYREAIESYREGPQDSAAVWNKIGIAYHQLQQLDMAKKHYQRAIKLNKSYTEAINNLGTVYYAQKSYRKAISTYRKALRVSETASVYSNLGTAYFARKKYNEATEAYEKALALDPLVFERKSSFGTLLQERNVEERAKFHFQMARMYAKAGRVELALQYLRKSLEEGYKERDKIADTPEFVGLKENEEFQQLLTMQPRVL